MARRAPARTNFVCFDCMTTHRGLCVPTARTGYIGDHSCPQCGWRMVNLGTRWRVPKKDRKAWDAFMAKVLKAPGINDAYKSVTRQKTQAALKKGQA